MAWVDGAGAEVREAFEAASIEHILIKGRAFARRLYAQAAERPYADTDILVPLAQREPAERMLESLGYTRHDRDGDRLGAPGYAHTFARTDGARIDLHWNLSGVTAPAQATWGLLRERTAEISIVGRPARVPDDCATALIVVLHNAHHGARWRSTQPDLERAVARLDLGAWEDAQALAAQLGAAEAFAAGLALSEAGRQIGQRLAAETSLSTEYRLRASAVSYPAWALHRIATVHGAAGRLRVIAGVLLPPPMVMRQFFPLARRGPLGLAAAYLLRPPRLAARTFPALVEYTRTRWTP